MSWATFCYRACSWYGSLMREAASGTFQFCGALSDFARTLMKASIITPTMNSLNFIDACISNVARQGDAVCEHIIADGGSSDGKIERVIELARIHSHLKLLRGPDRGQSDVMNKATEIANGEVIGILNVDDFYEDGVIPAALKIMQAMSRPCIVVGKCRVLDENGATRYWNCPADLRLESLLLGWSYAPYPCNPSAYFYTKQVHTLVGGYDVEDHYAMDFDFILSCISVAEARYVDAHWGNFRLVPGCKTYEDTETGPQRVREIIEKHRRRLPAAQRMRMRVRSVCHKAQGFKAKFF